MGIVNVTPDSFSDGGAYRSVQDAIDAGMRMVEQGANILDLGGESTRPGAVPVLADEELRRVVPVVEGLVKRGARVSIDTYKAVVAREALAAGALMVNDVTAFRDPEMPGVCAAARCEVCLMHMQGDPQTMQLDPKYGDVVREVRSFLLDRGEVAQQSGIAREKIWVDPGIGFGKTDEHNVQLIRGLGVLVETGYKVLIGVSRKGFLGRMLAGGGEAVPVLERLPGSLTIQVVAQLAGVRAIRTHDVLETRRAILACERVSDFF